MNIFRFCNFWKYSIKSNGLKYKYPEEIGGWNYFQGK